MSGKVTRGEMAEWTCKAHEIFPDDINIIYAIRRLIENCDKTSTDIDKCKPFYTGPTVSREFVEKWARRLVVEDTLLPNPQDLVDMLREAGVTVKE